MKLHLKPCKVDLKSLGLFLLQICGDILGGGFGEFKMPSPNVKFQDIQE